MRKAGAKRVGRMGSRKDAEGNRVSKSLKILSVGDRVRYALENIRKTGASKRPFPKQRWSDTTHTVQKIHPRKTAFARYTISNKEGRRFEREDLQKIPWLVFGFLEGTPETMCVENVYVSLSDDSNVFCYMYWSYTLCNGSASYSVSSKVGSPPFSLEAHTETHHCIFASWNAAIGETCFGQQFFFLRV